jgi:hypothetical protein
MWWEEDAVGPELSQEVEDPTKADDEVIVMKRKRSNWVAIFVSEEVSFIVKSVLAL